MKRPADPKFHKEGQAHPVCALTERLRHIFLSLGLDEVVNPAIVDEKEIDLQYGPAASLILDRVYYLAGLDRPEVGLSDARMAKIQEIVPGFDSKEKLQFFLRKFKEGKIAADDFIEEMVKELGIGEDQAKRLVEDVFVELSERKATATGKTLRSHMTSLWYRTLVEMEKQNSLPLKLFSIGSRFRREQRQDPQHLYESTSGSVAIMDDDFTLKDGENLTRQVLKELGFKKSEFKIKEVTSNYYRPGTDTEIYVSLRGQEYEVANLGFYSRESLDNYGIKHPVFNLGFGVERLTMLLHDISDIRALVYPQFYEEKAYSDEELVALISAEKKSLTPEGEQLARKLAKVAYENRKEIGPAEVLAFENSFHGKGVKVSIYNWDEGKALLSYAALNEVYVYNGSIYGLPPEGENLKGELLEAQRGGINTGLSFMDLIMQGFVAVLEERIKSNQTGYDIKFRDIKRPAQINLRIPDEIYDYITGKNKKIKIVGPLYFGVRAEFK